MQNLNVLLKGNYEAWDISCPWVMGRKYGSLLSRGTRVIRLVEKPSDSVPVRRTGMDPLVLWSTN